MFGCDDDDGGGGASAAEGSEGTEGSETGSGETMSGLPAETLASEVTEEEAEQVCMGLAASIAVIEDPMVDCTEQGLEETDDVTSCEEVRDNCLLEKEPEEDGGCTAEFILEGFADCELTIAEFESCLMNVADQLSGISCEDGEAPDEHPCITDLVERCPNVANGEGENEGGGGGGGDNSGPGDGDRRGQIMVQLNNISGLDGHIAVGTANFDGDRVAGFCESATSDDFSTTVAFREFNGNGDDPCDLGDPMLFEPGGYHIDVRVYVPGEMTAKACSDVGANVDNGDIQVTAPTFTNQCGG